MLFGQIISQALLAVTLSNEPFNRFFWLLYVENYNERKMLLIFGISLKRKLLKEKYSKSDYIRSRAYSAYIFYLQMDKQKSLRICTMVLLI